VGALARRGGIVLPFLNGVDAADVLAASGVSRAQLLGGVAYLTAFKTAPGRVERRGTHGRLIVGEFGRGPSARAEDVAEVLSEAGFEGSQSSPIERALWRKFVLVSALSAVCGPSRAPMGPIRAHVLGRHLLVGAVDEALGIARARGVGLDEADRAQVLRTLDAFPDDFHPSLVHDLALGRPTEVAVLNGALARMGREVGVPTPVHDAASLAIELATS
jgi:2-dehydropantoate 2-reductase